MTKAKQAAPLNEGLLMALQALDGQIARALQRTPAQEETLGVRKWEPFAQRIESVSTFLLEAFGEQRIALDGVLVLSQSLSKVLSILISELGPGGLGNIRAEYCRAALKQLQSDSHRGLQALATEELEN